MAPPGFPQGRRSREHLLPSVRKRSSRSPHPLSSRRPLGTAWYAALSWGSLLEGSLALLPNVCFQGNAAGTQAGAAVEIWQRVPSVCDSSSRSTSPSRARRCGWELGPSGAAPKRGWHLGHLGWAGAGRQMQSDPNKPESVQVIPSIL